MTHLVGVLTLVLVQIIGSGMMAGEAWVPVGSMYDFDVTCENAASEAGKGKIVVVAFPKDLFHHGRDRRVGVMDE